ncbi:sugar phosphate isomerase/epimerase [Microbacterium horticulturae]|uniref:Sugar phosphate isomerase/epimerase n=1 Tax=Microbacterium horticulturae TaxID=3028316 RepID=A0ABY8BYU8_9MICO|nr:sugar phosphate isomerase/epimerase [Microbacterium sp. KACC 23027]WEG09381.1 sugar phosphate isomerase/epimerase [Microbacterium sp. KACC 23027]
MRFSAYTLGLPTLTPDEGAREIADAGLTGVEWRVVDEPEQFAGETPSFTRNNLCTLGPLDGARARRLADDAGLEVVGIAPYIRVGDAAAFERAASLARAASAVLVRIRAPERDGRPFRELFAEGRDFVEEVADIAGRYGVTAVLEIHQGTMCPSASLGERLVRGLDPRRVGVIYDAGNLVIEGYEDTRMALDLLGEHLRHVHLKNTGWRRGADGAWEWFWAPLDEGILDAREFLDLLERAGYDGWISLEDLSTTRGPVATMRYNAALLREWGRL